jgi:hypothetical protein
MDFQSEIRLFNNLWYYHFNFCLCIHKGSQDNVVSIVTGLQVKQPRDHGRSKRIFTSPKCSDQLWEHLASFSVGTWWVHMQNFWWEGGRVCADPEAEFMFDFTKVCYKTHVLSITVA